MAKNRGDEGDLTDGRRFKWQSGGVADWASVDASTVIRAIEAASLTGGALRFGYTRDGGAYSVGVYGDGKPYTLYVKPSESMEELLEKLTDTFQEIRDEQSRTKKGIK